MDTTARSLDEADKALSLLRQRPGDPAIHARAARALGDAIHAHSREGEGMGRYERSRSGAMWMPRPTRWVRLPGTVLLAAGVTGVPLPQVWPRPVIVVGVAVAAVEGSAAAFNALSAQIAFDGGGSYLVGDGQAASWLHFGAASAIGGVTASGIVPIMQRVDASTTWQVTIRNESAGTNATPVVQWAIIDPIDYVTAPQGM